jgi:hypothetical protein
LGGDPWPIYLSPKENVGIPDDKKGIPQQVMPKELK